MCLRPVGETVSGVQISKAGRAIQTLKEWGGLSVGQSGEPAWEPGQPEYEMASAFLEGDGGQVPPEIQKLLASHPGLGPIGLRQAIPGYLIQLDDTPGSSHRCPLLAKGQGREGRCVVNLVPWTTGGFGPRISDQFARSRSGSHWVRRFEKLCAALLGQTPGQSGGLRAGLLEQLAAALRAAEAEKASTAILLLHEFRMPKGRGQQRKAVLADFDALSLALGGKPLREGSLGGPYRVPGSLEFPATVPVYIGTASRFLPGRSKTS